MKILVLKRHKFGIFSILFCSLEFPPSAGTKRGLALQVPALYIIIPRWKSKDRCWRHSYWREKLVLNGETWPVRGFDYRDVFDRQLIHAILDCLDALDSS